MDENSDFMLEVRAGIADADTMSIFFPLLRRSLVIDTRHSFDMPQFVGVMPQAGSMEDRIRSIEELRPELGKVRSILGIPWLRSVRALEEEGIADTIVGRLVVSGMESRDAESAVRRATAQLWKLERMAFARMIRGVGFATLWEAGR